MSNKIPKYQAPIQPMSPEDLKLRDEISTKQDERIVKFAVELMQKVAEHGIESIEVLGIKIQNSAPKLTAKTVPAGHVIIPEADARRLEEQGLVSFENGEDVDPFADPLLHPPGTN